MPKLYAFLLVIILSLPCFDLFAQTQIRIQRNYRPGEQNQEEVVFYYYRYTSAILDLSHFRSVVPECKPVVPERISILPPVMQGVADTVFAVAYVQATEARPGLLLIFLVGNYEGAQQVYFIDRNLDRDFTNDGPYFIFGEDEAYKKITFSPPAKDLEPYVLHLWNPNRHQQVEVREARSPRTYTIPDNTDPETARFIQVANAIRAGQHWELRVWALVGFGGVQYSFEDIATGYPTDYRVSYNVKGLGLQVNYALKQFKIGAMASYEDLYYWTSQKVVKLGEPFLSCIQNDCRWISNEYKGYNDVLMPDGRFSYGLRLEYDIPVSSMTYVGPVFNLAAYQYVGAQRTFVPDRYREPENQYSFAPDLAWGFGAIVVTDVTAHSSLVISLMAQSMGFQPQGYFENPAVTDVYRFKAQANIGLGYQVKFN